jgi:uncharacterized protein (TIGR02001 family)
MQKKTRFFLFDLLNDACRQVCIFVFSILLSAPCFAQLNGSVSIANDYVYRGISLSRGTPVTQLHVGFDDSSGLFVGGFASKTLGSSNGNVEPHRILYTGIAGKTTPELTWETGLKYVNYANTPSWNYNELFVGLSSERMNFRLHYAPKYLGLKQESIYVELNNDFVLSEVWSVTLHNGVFLQSHKPSAFDSRIGLSGNYPPWVLQFAVSKLQRQGLSNSSNRSGRNTFVTTLSLTF